MASDLIYREDAKVFVRHACYKKINPIDYLDEVPAADVRPVARGHWIEHISDLFPADSTIECDQCHAEQPTGIDDNFCPNCGADMREPNLDTIKKEAARMDDCPYCLETGNTFNVTKLDPINQVEVEVVACKKPYLMIRYYSNDEFRNWSVGMQIKYCPMCGRRLTDDRIETLSVLRK